MKDFKMINKNEDELLQNLALLIIRLNDSVIELKKITDKIIDTSMTISRMEDKIDIIVSNTIPEVEIR